MIIDIILDRKGGQPYTPKEFYNYLMGSPFDFYQKISATLDYGEEVDVQNILKEYIQNEGYSLDICEYIDSVSWLTPDNN